MVGKPLLIFANKQDQDGALSEEEVKTRLDLDTLLGEQQENGRVVSLTQLAVDCVCVRARVCVCVCVCVLCALK